MSKIDIARQAIQDRPGESNRAIAERIGVSHMTVARARNMKDVPPDVPLAGVLAVIPEHWALASIRTDALCRLQDRPALDAALAVVLRAAESGELDRDVLAGIVASRWDLKPGDRLQFDDGHLFREKARPRRSVQHRAE